MRSVIPSGDWVVRVTRSLVSRRGRAGLPWLINLLLLTAMTLCVMSGIYISAVVLPDIGVSLGPPTLAPVVDQ